VFPVLGALLLVDEFSDDVRASEKPRVQPFVLDLEAFAVVAAGAAAWEFRSAVRCRPFLADDEPVVVEFVDSGRVLDQIAGFEFVVELRSLRAESSGANRTGRGQWFKPAGLRRVSRRA